MFQLPSWRRNKPRYHRLTACELIHQAKAELEVRCTPGDLVHIAFDPHCDIGTVEEDSTHRAYQNQGEAIDRAQLVAKGPNLR